MGLLGRGGQFTVNNQMNMKIVVDHTLGRLYVMEFDQKLSKTTIGGMVEGWYKR